MDLREELFSNRDMAYRDFHSRLLPTVNKDMIIGVRVPVLRRIAAQAYREDAHNDCYYYEEKMVRGFVVGLKQCSISEHMRDIADFVPLIDNWAVCDCCASSFKFTAQNRDELYDFYLSFIGQGEYPTRFAVVMLMNYYLTDEYIDRVLDVLMTVDNEYYYVNMAIAWALSIAFVKYQDKVMPMITSMTMPPELQNKTIQKIKESLRVDPDTKKMLNVFKL